MNHPDMEAATKFQAIYLGKQLEGKILRGTKFWQMVSEAGHSIDEESALKNTITKKVGKEEIKLDAAQFIVDAPTLDDEEVSHLRSLKDSGTLNNKSGFG
ncbi:hypothetical protein [Nostoc sp.]